MNVINFYLPSQFISILLSFLVIVLLSKKTLINSLYQLKFFHVLFAFFTFSVLMFVLHYDNDFSFSLLVIKQGLLKGIAIPIIGILTLALLNFDFFKFFKLYAIFGIVLGTIEIVLGNSFSLDEGTPKSFSFILLFSIPFFSFLHFKLPAFLFSLFLAFYHIISEDIYITSADFATVLFSLILSGLYLFFTAKKVFVVFLFSFFFFVVFSGLDIYDVLLNIGLTPSSANKIAAPFSLFSIVLDSGFELVPWTIHVRYVEMINILDRNWFNNIFGSGVFSTITESSEYYRALLNIGTDYTDVEIQNGKFFSLHNLPRGFLHFGFIYFILIFWWYFKLISWLIKRQKIEKKFAYFYVLNFLFISALWNPYISSMFYLYILYKFRFNLPMISDHEN